MAGSCADGGAPRKSILQGMYDALTGRMRSLVSRPISVFSVFPFEIDIFQRPAESLDELGRKSEYPRQAAIAFDHGGPAAKARRP
jgi:hypothetical protein